MPSSWYGADIHVGYVENLNSYDTLKYRGHNGLMMVSKHPITKRNSIVKDVYEIQSGALYGEVRGVQIVCAHHSQDNKRNNMYELLLALDLLNEKDNCSPQVLMGDLNTGLKPQF